MIRGGGGGGGGVSSPAGLSTPASSSRSYLNDGRSLFHRQLRKQMLDAARSICSGRLEERAAELEQARISEFDECRQRLVIGTKETSHGARCVRSHRWLGCGGQFVVVAKTNREGQRGERGVRGWV